MIKLSNDAQLPAVMSRFAVRPTHAAIVSHSVHSLPDGMSLPTAYSTIPKEQIEAIYAYGTVNESGTFVPDSYSEAIIHVMVDVTDYDSLHPESLVVQANTQIALASRNLRSAGVSPNPTKPWLSVVTASKQENDFKKRDLDAYFAFAIPGLQGTVV